MRNMSVDDYSSMQLTEEFETAHSFNYALIKSDYGFPSDFFICNFEGTDPQMRRDQVSIDGTILY